MLFGGGGAEAPSTAEGEAAGGQAVSVVERRWRRVLRHMEQAEEEQRGRSRGDGGGAAAEGAREGQRRGGLRHTGAVAR
eukprot:COSAG01_NODE_476_length_16515_cov_37.730690_10_plen_79_part_00